MAVSEELRIEIIARAKQAVKEFGKVEKEFGKVEKSTGSLGKSLKKLGLIAMAAVALKQIIKVAKSSVEAYKVQETAVRNLNSALGATGQFTAEASADLQRYASELQGLTVVGDEATLAAMQLGINMGLSADEVKGATENAIGLSRAYGVDLKTAMRAVASAQTGNTSMLSRYMPQIREATTETEKMAIAQASLASAFAVARGEVDTLAGAQQQMKNALGDLGELFGAILASSMKETAQKITEIVTAFQSFVTEADNAIIIGEIVGYIGGTFAVLWSIVKQVFGLIIDAVKIVIEPLQDLQLEGEKMTWVWDLLGAAMQYVGAFSRVLTTAIRAQINVIIEFGKAAVASFNVIKAGIDRIKGDISKEEFRAIARDAGEAWKSVGSEIVVGFVDTFAQIKTEVVSFRDGAEKAAGEFERTFRNASDKVAVSVTGALTGDGFKKLPMSGAKTTEGGEDSAAVEEARNALIERFREEWAFRAETQRIIEETRNAEIAAIEASKEAEALRHDAKMENLQIELDTYASYAGSAGQIFSNLINSMMQGDEKLSKKRKRAIIVLFRMQQLASMAQIAINTASAVVEALPNIPLSVLVAAIGASQLVAAGAAKPPVMMAEGGIILPTPGGTTAILGEAGKPEAVIPLDRLGGIGTTIVNVYGSIGSQEDVATWVYEGIERARHMGKVA